MKARTLRAYLDRRTPPRPAPKKNDIRTTDPSNGKKKEYDLGAAVFEMADPFDGPVDAADLCTEMCVRKHVLDAGIHLEHSCG